MREFSTLNKQQAIDYAEKQCLITAKHVYRDELKKGYKLDEVYLLRSCWN